MPEYIIDPIVEDKLWDIWRFIARENPDAATRMIEAACETIKALAINPGLGRTTGFGNSRLLGIRSFRVTGFDNHLVFYRIVGDLIQVHHVYHGARS